MKMKLLALALLSGFAATPAMAADSGMYVVGSLGLTSNIQDVDPGVSFGGLFGYQINRSFGIEGGYVSLLNKAAVKGLPAGFSGDVSVSGLAAAGTYTFHINDRFSVLGRLGYSKLSSKWNASGPGFSDSGTDSSSGVMYGAAGQFQITNALGVRAGIDFYKDNSGGNSGTANNLNAAVVYKF